MLRIPELTDSIPVQDIATLLFFTPIVLASGYSARINTGIVRECSDQYCAQLPNHLTPCDIRSRYSSIKYIKEDTVS